MKAVTVARKPLSGTVATTTLEHGCGGLNIDACRIALASDSRLNKGGSYSGNRTGSNASSVFNSGNGRVEYTEPPGRWPANLILQHLDGCRCDGVKRVKACGVGAVSRSTGKENGGQTGAAYGAESRTAGTEMINYADKDGKESVANWICVDGCPVKALDEQSGTLKSGAMDSVAKGGQYTTYGKMYERRVVSPASEGGASRFFKQVKP